MTYVEIFSSYLIADCDQRAFVLKAVGIEHLVTRIENRFALLVPEAVTERALDQLRHYEEESRPTPPPAPLQLHRRAWVGSSLFVVILLGVAFCAGDDAGGFDWYETGVLLRSSITHGELWRWVTALTLHADVAHLLGNLAFGIPYGYFASQLLGGARAWLTILFAAVAANAIDAALMHDQQGSIGASTSVFAMLGLVGAFAWRRGESKFQRWAHRIAPLVAAIALLGLTGVGDAQTDIIAHLAGFACGTLAGIAHARLGRQRTESRGLAIALGLVTVLVVIGAWIWGLATAR